MNSLARATGFQAGWGVPIARQSAEEIGDMWAVSLDLTILSVADLGRPQAR